MLAPMGDILKLIWWTVIGLFRSRSSLEAEILTLRLSLLYTLSHWRKAANRAMLRLMRDVLKLISWVVVRLFRSRASLEAEIVALRHQLWLRTRNRPGHRRNCTSPLRALPMRSSASRLPRTFATGSRSVCGQAARSSFPTSRSAERRAPLAPTSR